MTPILFHINFGRIFTMNFLNFEARDKKYIQYSSNSPYDLDEE